MNPNIRQKVVPHRLQGVLPEGTTLEGLVAMFVNEADENNCLSELCVDLKDDNPSTDFHKLLDHCLGFDNPFRTGRPRWYDDRLPGMQPFIGRDGLRSGLFDTLEAHPGNPRVMTVHGEAPGKTYCRCLVQHVARKLGFGPPILVNLFDAESVNRLAELIVDKLGIEHTDLKARFSTEVREGKHFNEWLIGRVAQFDRRRRLVFVFDHIAKPGIPQDVANTVLDLAQRIMRRELENIWIFLLDCPVTDALEEEDLPFEEEVLPLPKDSITDFLSWLQLYLKKNGQAPPAFSQEITDLLGKPFPLNKRQLWGLKKAIIQWIRENER